MNYLEPTVNYNGFLVRRREKFRIMKITKKNAEKNKIVVLNGKALNKYTDKVLFPEKLEKANRALKEVGLPKQWLKASSK